MSIQRALSVDRSFYQDAACRSADGSTPKVAWTASTGRKYRIGGHIYPGEKLIDLALLTCSGCPVQWECASAAIEADERAGVWADTLDNLNWLRRQEADPATTLEMAKSAGVSVQRTIVLLKTRLT